MTQFLLPFIFVVLWSSAFVAGKAGVQHATPFAFLAIRFSIVALIFIVVAVGCRIWCNKESAVTSQDSSKEPILQTAFVGVLIHGIYLGSTFFAMANGLGAALAADCIIQPLLTTALAIFLFNEKPPYSVDRHFYRLYGCCCCDIAIYWNKCTNVIGHILCFGLMAITTGTLFKNVLAAQLVC